MPTKAIPKTTVLFATSRELTGHTAGGSPYFNDVATDPPSLICASATVDKLDIFSPAKGKITAWTDLHTGGFAPNDIAAIANSGNDVLVFVHGSSNAFEDAIIRGAYNKAWLAMASDHGLKSDFDVVVFSWPSFSYPYWFLLADFIDYKNDQKQAAASAPHFGLFLKIITDLRAQIGGRRINLLCHSMGNYMLGGAVEMWSHANPEASEPLFDQVVLAAADEIATTFSTPEDGRLAGLRKLGKKVAVYYSYDDIMMTLSQKVNCNFRLGYDGPPNASDTEFFPPGVYEFVDCTGVNDYISSLVEQPDRSHQYYRQSPTVRLDLAQVLAGIKPQRLRFDPRANAYGLFPI